MATMFWGGTSARMLWTCWKTNPPPTRRIFTCSLTCLCTSAGVNPHSSRAVEAEIVVRGASVASGWGQVLTSGDLHAHNDFELPDAVHPEAAGAAVSGGRVVHRF